MFILSLLACSQLRTITISDSSTTTVPEGSILEDLVGDLGFSDFISMDLTESAALRNQGVQPGDIEEVRLTVFELEATAPDGADLNFIESMVVDVESPDVATQQLASATDFPVGEALVPFVIEDLDLTPYVVSESMTFTTDVTAHRPDDETTVVARFEVEVTATVQGIRNQAEQARDE